MILRTVNPQKVIILPNWPFQSGVFTFWESMKLKSCYLLYPTSIEKSQERPECATYQKVYQKRGWETKEISTFSITM